MLIELEIIWTKYNSNMKKIVNYLYQFILDQLTLINCSNNKNNEKKWEIKTKQKTCNFYRFFIMVAIFTNYYQVQTVKVDKP